MRFFGASTSDGGSYLEMENTTGSSFFMPRLRIGVYCEAKDFCIKEVNDFATCEDVCQTLAEDLGLDPAISECFGLAYMSKAGHYVWLPHNRSPVECRQQLVFRMRFLPLEKKIDTLFSNHKSCLRYLFFQMKFDYVHGHIPFYNKKEKEKDCRGVGALIILIVMRLWAQNSGKREAIEEFLKEHDLKDFFPSSLQKNMIDWKILKSGIKDKVRQYQEGHPARDYEAESVMRSCLAHLLKNGVEFFREEYTYCHLDIEYREVKESDTSGQTTTYFKPELKQFSKMSLGIDFKGVYSVISFKSKVIKMFL